MMAGIHARSPVERAAWLRQVIKSSIKSVDAIKAAVYLADCCNSTTGQCNPSKSRIERECAMSRKNGRRALRELEEAGLIEVDTFGFGSYEYRNKTNQYFLVLRGEGNRERPDDGEQDENEGERGVSQLTPKPSSEPSLEPSKKPVTEYRSASAPESGSESGFIPEAWRPSRADVDFALRFGMDNKVVEREVPKFITHNRNERVVHWNCSLNWQRWVTAWESYRVEKLKEVPSGDKHADSIKRAIKSEKPCWERIVTKSPERDPTGFVRSGCSMFGGCMCSQEQRQEIINRAMPLAKAS